MPKIDPESHLPKPDTASKPNPAIKQADRDLRRGLVDTDMWATPGLDAERRQAATTRDPKTDAPAPGSGKSVTRPVP